MKCNHENVLCNCTQNVKAADMNLTSGACFSNGIFIFPPELNMENISFN